jgi:cellulose synthase (UDP-forming)
LLNLFPALLSYTLLLLGFAILAPMLPWNKTYLRALVAVVAVYFNMNYLWWRFHDTLPAAGLTLAFAWAAVIFAAELLATIQSSFHTLLFVKLSNHTPQADIHEERLRTAAKVPSIDVFLPTYNESWEILHPAIFAAQQLDWPDFTVYVLDDGKRDWLRDNCEQYGINYMRRETRKGYKAGNVNNGMLYSTGEFVLCIDVDFTVYPNLLYRTVGFMEDPKICIVQMPANFQNADPIQYNMLGESSWPEEQRVFTDVAQPARDTWDSAFCYGSVFLARRSALEAIGGIPEDSITEDLYSSYTLIGAGYKIRYLNETLCQGLAAESLGSYLRQRCRWAVGSMQCLYLPNGPLRGKGLSLKDRLFYLDPICFYLSYFFPFFMLYAPAVYWWTGIPPFNATVGHLLRMLVPRLAVSVISMYWLSGRKVVPIVSELGRAVGLHYYIPNILSGLFDPFGHAFRVTLKGETREKYVIQWHPIRSLLVLAIITIVGMCLNLTKHGTVWLLWDPNTPQVLAFTIFNMWIIFLACLVCFERPADGHTRFNRAATQGSFTGSMVAIFRRVFA